MNEKNKKDDKSTWAIGGGLLLGLGVGFFFLQNIDSRVIRTDNWCCLYVAFIACI